MKFWAVVAFLLSGQPLEPVWHTNEQSCLRGVTEAIVLLNAQGYVLRAVECFEIEVTIRQIPDAEENP